MFYSKEVKLYDRVVLTATLGVTGFHRFFWGDPVVPIVWLTFFACGIATTQTPVGFYTLALLYGISAIETLYWMRKADPHPNWIRAYHFYKRYTIGSIAMGLQRGGLECHEINWSQARIVHGATIDVNSFEMPIEFVYEDKLYQFYGVAPQKMCVACLFDPVCEGIWVEARTPEAKQ